MRCKIALLLLLFAPWSFATEKVSSGVHDVFAAQSATGTTTDQLHFPAGGLSKHTATLIVTGSPTGCTYNLEGSPDGSHWFDISGNQTCTSSIMFHVVNKNVTWIQGHLTVLSGGSSPTVQLIYEGSR